MNRRHLLALLSVLLLAACSAASGDLGSLPPATSSDEPSIDVPSGEPTPGATDPGASPDGTPGGGETTTVRAYFFLGSFTDNAGLVPVLREIPKTQAVGAAAMAALLAGPNDDELGARPAMYTEVPEGTRFLGLEIKDRIAIVDLSKEFETAGGSLTALGRLAQVVYTLTQFPTVDGVTFKLDGQPVEVFGSEGVVLAEPVSREDYVDQLPAIFVDRPAWGGAVSSPARIAGVANVFEATFTVRIADGDGRGLAQATVMATCGTGCWGTFDQSIPYTVATAGWGTLQVYELSAKDGSIENLTEYPIWLTP